MKKIAIIQSNYIPWKGYFDIINDVDEFIFHDDLQYTKNDWRNRNLIKTENGTKWLTVPVGTNEHRMICDVEITDSKWQKKHYNLIHHNYSKSEHYNRYKELLHMIYIDLKWSNLSELNQFLIKSISHELLNINTKFRDSREFNLNCSNHKKVLSIVKAAGAHIYISGPAAKSYINEQDFIDNNIEIIWKDYSGYPVYPQNHGNFCHKVSIFDLLFSVGKKAPYYIWGWRI